MKKKFLLLYFVGFFQMQSFSLGLQHRADGKRDEDSAKQGKPDGREDGNP